MRYEFGGLIFGGAYEWRGLFSEFDGILVAHALYGEYMLKFCGLYSQYSSAKRNPSNTKSSPLPEEASSERWQDNTNFQPKMPEHHLASCFNFYLSYVTVCLCAGPS